MRFLLFFLGVISWAFDAQAIVFQSSSRALSYNNVAKYASPKKSAPVATPNPVVKNKHVPQTKDVDLTAVYSADVSLSKGDSVIIKVNEESCCEWKISYNKGKLSLTGNIVKNNERIITLKQLNDGNSQIALDNIKKENGDYYQNKLVNVTGE